MRSISKSNAHFLVVLYITFFVYLFTIRFSFLASAYVLAALYFYLFSTVKADSSTVHNCLILFLVNIIISIFVGFNWRETSLLLWILLLIPIFQSSFIHREQFQQFLNSTYIAYLALSILVTFQIIPAGFDSGHGELNQFDTLLGDSSFITLVGFGGSTADIDSYSVIVCVYNLLLNNDRKNKIFMVILSSLAALATFRFTPLISVVLALFVVLSGNERFLCYSRIVYIIVLSVSFLVLFAFPKADDLLFVATHGRSEIWSMYINILSKDDLSKFLFGYREAHLPYISVSIWQDEFSNAHSSFLRLFLHWGIIMYIIFMLYFLCLYFRTNSRKIIFLQSVIFTAAITNMNIFWNDNPIYWFILFYISYCYCKETNQDEINVAHEYRN